MTLMFHTLKGRKLMNPSPAWALWGPEETLLVNLAFHFHGAQLLCWKEEPGVGGKALVLSLGSATLNIRDFILKMKMETPPGYSGVFFSLFYHLFHFFFKIRSWPTKLISWPNHWSWKPWHNSYLIILFFLGNTRIWTWNVSVQHLCITRITSLYSFEIKEKNASFMDTESGMLWAGRLRSCVALSEFPNLSVSLFPVF